MRQRLEAAFAGNGARARSVRSVVLVGIGFGGANALRLASSLVLTRLLYPEAFGLIALVQIFITALYMLSDIGINLSIIQNKRGAEPDFLNTAWTIQIVRGLILWVGSCALAYPAALIYGEAQLAQLLPVVGLNAVLLGFATTRVALATRNLQLGVQTFTELASQAFGIIATIVLAYLTQSVWAIVLGGLLATASKVVAQHLLLKGPRNRLRFDRDIASDIIGFGKYIFLSSIAGFLVNQGDIAILGRFISISELGIFLIAYNLAMLPLHLVQAAGGQVMFPIYRRFLTTAAPENRLKTSRARRLLVISAIVLSGLLSLISVPLVNLMYDSRYHDAGPILALMGFSVAAQIAASNYDGAHLSHGDSRRHFHLICLHAVIQIGVSLWLISWFGLIGAIFALGATVLMIYPFRAALARRYNAWDPKTDAIALLVGLSFATVAFFIWNTPLMSFLQK